MQQLKNLILLLLCNIFCNTVMSQSSDMSLFQNFCNKLVLQNKYFKIVKSLPGTILVEDPVEDKISVIYGEPSKSLIEFKKNNMATQIEMLNTLELPIFPLKDTVYVIDTIFTFSSLTYIANGIVFMIERKPTDRNTISIMNLENIWIRKNLFHLTLYNPGWENKLDYSFEMEDNKFKAAGFRKLSPHPEFQ